MLTDNYDGTFTDRASNQIYAADGTYLGDAVLPDRSAPGAGSAPQTNPLDALIHGIESVFQTYGEVQQAAQQAGIVQTPGPSAAQQAAVAQQAQVAAAAASAANTKLLIIAGAVLVAIYFLKR